MQQPVDPAVLRILDAALNRAGEGLRVVEDYMRMVLNDAHLSRLVKEMRHALEDAAQQWLTSGDRLYARNTIGDVGTLITTAGEDHRSGAWQVAAASFKRAEQALRTLEEYGKLVDTPFAAACEALRYRLYTLEKMAYLTTDSQTRLRDVSLYFLIEGGDSTTDLDETLTLLTGIGANAIQLRDKHLCDSQLLHCAKHLRRETRRHDILFLVNDRPDMAVAADADGVHLGQDDMPVADARGIVGPNRLIGVSTHNIDQARQAVMDGANYLGAGPTFPSRTKSFDAFPGLDYLREVAAEVSLPTFAIGGIDQSNLDQVFATGITRVAMSVGTSDAGNPAEKATAVSALLNDEEFMTRNSPARTQQRLL